MQQYNRNERFKRSVRLAQLKDEQGFTLIELAIVLVIIGLILGSVLKGKDLINSAKRKEFYSSFVKTWELSIVSYYDQTGYLLGDGVDNGGTAAAADGVFDGTINSAAEFIRLDTALKEKGLQVTQTNTATSYQFSYTGEYSGHQTVTLNLLNTTNYGQADNTMRISNLPTDLAYALDKIIDGQVDATTGVFVLNGGAAGATWGDASTVPTVTAAYRLSIP
jgi:prepilin-type N-terminal cleavage/methylation domain-containing protein